MPTFSLILNGLLVEVYLSPEEDWRFDDVLIWDMTGGPNNSRRNTDYTVLV